MTLGRSLANSLDFSAVRQAIWRHLPQFLRTGALWVVLRERNQRRTAIEDTDTADRTPPAAIENVAALALARGHDTLATGSTMVDGYECFPMAAATRWWASSSSAAAASR